MFALFQETVGHQNLAAKGIRLAATIAKRIIQFGGFKASLDLPAFTRTSLLQPAHWMAHKPTILPTKPLLWQSLAHIP
jgi:hypothetical protein